MKNAFFLVIILSVGCASQQPRVNIEYGACISSDPPISFVLFQAEPIRDDSMWNLRGILRDRDSASSVLIGANVKINGIYRTSTDTKGEFQLSSVQRQDTIAFSYIGFQITRVTVAELIRSLATGRQSTGPK